MKPICLNLSECNGLGDLICATPAIRKVSEAYNQKITIISQMPELFKNNPYVDKSYKNSSIDMDFFNQFYLMHNSFYNMGKKNDKGIEYKHNRIDIRQVHAINLGFMLSKDEMQCFYRPTEPSKFNIEADKYVVIHPVMNWASRTWDEQNWISLCKMLNQEGIKIVAIGKDSSETGFFNVEKPTFNLEIENGINLLNKTNISDCWHIINNSSCFITMDSGLLHLAGTTEAHIIHLGSHILPEFRIPYRHGIQGYKHSYIHGTCELFCGSDMKYGVNEWGDIQSVPPLIKCLENKETFECHPSPHRVFNEILSII